MAHRPWEDLMATDRLFQFNLFAIREHLAAGGGVLGDAIGQASPQQLRHIADWASRPLGDPLYAALDEQLVAAAELVLGVKADPQPDPRDEQLMLVITPAAIREHFEVEEGYIADAVRAADDDELRALGEWCLEQDTLYKEFHRLLTSGVEELLLNDR